MGMGHAVILGYVAIFSVIGLALRIAYVADARVKEQRREKRIQMEWQETKEYQ